MTEQPALPGMGSREEAPSTNGCEGRAPRRPGRTGVGRRRLSPVVVRVIAADPWYVWAECPDWATPREWGPYVRWADAGAVAHRLRVAFDREAVEVGGE